MIFSTTKINDPPEVLFYEDFRRVGSMKEAKAQGVYRLEGKTYIVKDGDIMHILSSA